MAELSLAKVDMENVLLRLTRYAQRLFGAFRMRGLEPIDIVYPGGEGPDDLAMNLLLRLLDPQDSSVRWGEGRPAPTTDTLFAFLKHALWRDFLDLKKSKRYRTTVYAKTGESEEEGMIISDLAVFIETPEGLLLKQERIAALLAQFADDPKAHEILRLQLDPQGYNAFTNQELAQLLDTTVADIENCKKRANNRFLRIIKREGEKPNA